MGWEVQKIIRVHVRTQANNLSIASTEVSREQSANVIIWGGTVCGVTAAIASTRTDPKLKVLWLVSTARVRVVP